jgi:hypothetical protein
MIAGKIKTSFGISTDAVRCALSLVNRQFSLPIDGVLANDEVYGPFISSTLTTIEIIWVKQSQ